MMVSVYTIILHNNFYQKKKKMFYIEVASFQEDDSDAESVHDYDVNADNSNSLQNTDKLPLEILEAIKSLGLVEKLWQKAQPIAENVSEILKINDNGLIKK